MVKIMLALVVIVPLIAAILGIAAVKDPKKAKYIAVAGSIISFASVALVGYGTATIPWLSVGVHVFNISISVTPLNYLLLFLVLLVGVFVMVYSVGYMTTLSEHRRFFLEIIAFQTAMAVFAVSGNFITLFFAWEFLSLTSYLLIGFWNHRDSANRAARRSLTIIFIGDLALLGSIIMFWSAFGTLEFSSIISMLSSVHPAGVSIASMLLLIAIFTKSAQFPFHEWLIDAMEGPTPVSAFLHSSTMVKAGVFVAIILAPIFYVGGTDGFMVAIGIVTAVIATVAAAREMHIKKVIAYSTIQELSIMLVAAGSSFILPAIYFFFAQTFYKALLFFSSGVSMESTGKENLNDMYGLRSSKILYASTIFGVLSLAGFIPFSGFFASSLIGTSLLSNTVVYAIMLGISMLTSFYIFRWVSFQARTTKSVEITANYMSTPANMKYPIALLAAFTLLASAFIIYMPGFLNYGGYLNYLSIPNSVNLSIQDGILFTILVSAGAALAYLVYYKNIIKFSAKSMDIFLYTRPIMNLIYRVFTMVTYGIAEGASVFDSYLSDGFDMLGRLTYRSGYILRRASVGDINMYALIFIIGIIALLIPFYLLVIV